MVFLFGAYMITERKDNDIWNDIFVLVFYVSDCSSSIWIHSSDVWKMKMNKNQFSNGNKQIFKEALAVLCLMLFLASVGFGLAYYKGHTIWQPDPIEEEY